MNPWRPLSSVRSFSLRLTYRAAARCLSTSLKEPREPLRILFCGSDYFSIDSLRALHQLHQEDQSIIESIDVVHRPGKPFGRGFKLIKEVPIKQAAADLQLRAHAIDTFTAWQPPDVNLIIAVSFGLLIPKRIINSSKFGGLNLHPSLLPDLRGSAPVHHALLLRRPYTGITLQTLHPTAFDQGTILSRSAPIPILPTHTPSTLLAALSPLGAALLTTALRTRLYEQPQPPSPSPSDHNISDSAPTSASPPTADDAGPVARAPKLRKEDARVEWCSRTADDILLRHRVLGDLWDETLHPAGKRVVYKKLAAVGGDGEATKVLRAVQIGEVAPGRMVVVRENGRGKRKERYYMVTADRPPGLVRVEEFLIEGHAVGYVDGELRESMIEVLGVQ